MISLSWELCLIGYRNWTSICRQDEIVTGDGRISYYCLIAPPGNIHEKKS